MKKHFVLILLVCANLCFSQSRLRVQRLNVEDGLSQSSVYSVLQDSYGYIWMATGDGLNRYDGKEFISYKSRLNDTGSASLRDRNINSVLFEDGFHNFWFAADEGVYCMDRKTNKFSVCINKRESGYSSRVVGADSDMVWALITGKGIYKIEAATKRARSYPFTDSFQTTKGICPLITGGVNTKKGLWIADMKGLIWFDKATARDKRVLTKEGIRNIYKLKNGLLLLSVMNGVVVVDPVDMKERFIHILLPGKETFYSNSIVQDTVSGYVYVSELQGGGIWKIDVGSGSYELLKVQDNAIVRLYIDRSQNLWIGTDGGGVYKLDIKPPKFFCYFPRSADGSGAMVKSIYRSNPGEMWIGLYGKGVIKYDPVTGAETKVDLGSGTDGMHVNSIFRDTDGEMVVAFNNKIVWIDAATGKRKGQCVLQYLPYMGNAVPIVYSLLEQPKGKFFAGGDQGVFLYRKEQADAVAKQAVPFLSNSYNGWIYNLTKLGDNILYIGRRNGFSKVRMVNDSTPELLKYGLPDLPIRHFYKSAGTPVLWLASEQGLIAFNEATDKYTVFDESDGIANSYIYAILPQNDSVLWVSTNKGIARVGIHYGDCSHIEATFTNYTSRDGLQSNEFNSGAFFKCSDGTLMFGGIAGINWFDPTKITPNPYKAQPAITGIYVDDTLAERDATMFLDELVLPYNRNTVSITFKALEFTQPEQNRFAYKLQGQDKDWVYTANDKVRYSKLTPGKYQFLLKVTNNEGVWNEEPLKLVIVITPPYWQTWWFRALVMLLAGIGIAGIVRYYIHLKVRAKTRELEKQHALNMERIRISKDVHDDIGSGLSKISLLSEMAKRKITDNQLPGKDVGNISVISKELVDNMRDLIWVLNPENTTLDNLVSRMREYCADYLDGVNIASEFSFPEHVPDMNISRDVQRNIFSTVKEAINNSVKHAHAGLIKISAVMQGNILCIVIADDGDGFVISDARAGGNGLRNMRNRIESIGGRFEMVTNKGSGTEIKISVALAGQGSI